MWESRRTQSREYKYGNHTEAPLNTRAMLQRKTTRVWEYQLPFFFFLGFQRVFLPHNEHTHTQTKCSRTNTSWANAAMVAKRRAAHCVFSSDIVAQKVANCPALHVAPQKYALHRRSQCTNHRNNTKRKISMMRYILKRCYVFRGNPQPCSHQQRVQPCCGSNTWETCNRMQRAHSMLWLTPTHMAFLLEKRFWKTHCFRSLLAALRKKT